MFINGSLKMRDHIRLNAKARTNRSFNEFHWYENDLFYTHCVCISLETI